MINVVLVGKKGQNLTGAVREATIETMNAIAAAAEARGVERSGTMPQTLLAQAQSQINALIA